MYDLQMGVNLKVGPIELPLMVQNHIGATQVYLALPFVALFGPTTEALRIMTIVVGLVTLAATFLFMSQMYGSHAAFYGCLWLACFPSFIFWSRQGVFVTSIAACFIMCALAVGIYGWRAQRLWALGLAALFLGLAVYSKLNAVWVLIGLLIWSALSHLHRRAPYAHVQTQRVRNLPPSAREAHGYVTRAINPRDALVVGLASFIAGLWPFILYNVMTGGATLRVVRENAVDTYLGVSNIQFLPNLQKRLLQFVDIIRSGDHLWYLGDSYPNDLALLSIILALAILVVDCLKRKDGRWRETLFAPFVTLVSILLSCFTISDL